MAIVYKATVVPTKPEIVEAWLDRETWGGGGDVERIGSYRFDDPDGEVGVEGVLVRRARRVLQAAMTYRAEPLAGADQYLIGTMVHSVLSDRWIYDAAGDPVALGCFELALRGGLSQAAEEVWNGDELVEVRKPSVTVEAVGTDVPPADAKVRLTREVDHPLDGPRQLVARWDGGSGVVAHLTS